MKVKTESDEQKHELDRKIHNLLTAAVSIVVMVNCVAPSRPWLTDVI